ncbi:hypothetical protein ACH5RR_040233 [Cinchona calisaya]|uniref:rRNA N-glycosidase n=1 Tax=Cinchona calisaya TaxID=153742 RepID=A0ABD2XT75_9GENT
MAGRGAGSVINNSPPIPGAVRLLYQRIIPGQLVTQPRITFFRHEDYHNYTLLIDFLATKSDGYYRLHAPTGAADVPRIRYTKIGDHKLLYPIESEPWDTFQETVDIVYLERAHT